jgi:hypothetical protein
MTVCVFIGTKRTNKIKSLKVMITPFVILKLVIHFFTGESKFNSIHLVLVDHGQLTFTD